MGRKTEKNHPKSHTLPSSPTHSFSSSSSSDFEFTISLSPRKSATTTLCPADELFYKGQLLPLHLSPRLSMVRTLLSSSSISSSSDTTTTASRDSTGSTGSSTDSHSSFPTDLADCDSSRPSSVAEDDELKRLNHFHHQQIKKAKYFSLSRFSSVFRKEPKPHDSAAAADNPSGSSVKRMSATAKEVIRKYFKKVKPLYEKLSQKQHQKMSASSINFSDLAMKTDGSMKDRERDVPIIENSRKDNNGSLSHSFSGNLKYPRTRRSYVSSCPSSMRSSPSHSGILYRTGFSGVINPARGMAYSDASSMEELQSAIQGAIAHCKNSMIQNNKSLVSNEI